MIDKVSLILQTQMAALHRKYGSLCPKELQDALRAVHTAIDAAVDVAQEAYQMKWQKTDSKENE